MADKDLIPFYLQGRDARSLNKIQRFVDHPGDLADQVAERGFAELRTIIGTACRQAAGQLSGDRRLRDKWMTENEAELKESGLSAILHDDAWKAYCCGMADELAYTLETDVLAELAGEDSDDPGDDDEGDSEDDEAKERTMDAADRATGGDRTRPRSSKKGG